MSESTQTPEPWFYRPKHNGDIVYYTDVGTNYVTVASYVDPPDGERIIQCVNAMKGISQPIEFVTGLKARITEAVELLTDAIGPLVASAAESGDYSLVHRIHDMVRKIHK